MSYEVGIDLVEIERIKTLLSVKFVKRILSDIEFEYYSGITDESRRLTYLAGRFSAKEALFKALKNGDKTANYSDFTVINDEFGAPFFQSNTKLETYQVRLSISHTTNYAVSIVILEKIV